MSAAPQVTPVKTGPQKRPSKAKPAPAAFAKGVRAEDIPLGSQLHVSPREEKALKEWLPTIAKLPT